MTPASFAAWCAAQAGGGAAEAAVRGRPVGSLRVWLSAELCLDLLAEPGLRLGPPAALAAWARRLAAAFEHAAQGAVAGWRSGQGAQAQEGASLLLAPAELDTLQAAALRHGLRIGAMHPLWAGVLALARGAGLLPVQGTLLLAEGPHVQAVTLQAGRVAAIASHWLPEARAEALQGLALSTAAPVVVAGHSLPGAVPASVQVLVPPAGEAQALLDALEPLAGPLSPDFAGDVAAGGASSPSRVGWALAATAVVVVALAGLDAWQAHRAWREAIAHEAARPRAPATASVARAVAEPPRPFAHPWSDWFVALEAASVPGVQWSSVEHRAETGASRLSGRAVHIEQALAATRQLAASPALADAWLVRAQAAPGGGSGAGADGIEFELGARMAAGGRP